MKDQFELWLDTLPYPALLLSELGKVSVRNRLARRLLPSLPRLREHLRTSPLENDAFLVRLSLDEIDYMVMILPLPDGRKLLCFFEHFLPLQESFSRAIVGKMQDFFWTLQNQQQIPGSENVVYLDQIAARVCALRTQGEDYLRLVEPPRLLLEDEEKSCSLEGFFSYLKRALSARGLCINATFPKGATVCSQGSVLSYLVLNLVHFIRLYEGERSTAVLVTEEGGQMRFSVEFPDNGTVGTSLEAMICRGEVNEEILRTLPMFCILRMCLEKGICFSALAREGSFSFSFFLKKGDQSPALFLSDATAAEVVELLRIVKLFFS